MRIEWLEDKLKTTQDERLEFGSLAIKRIEELEAQNAELAAMLKEDKRDTDALIEELEVKLKAAEACIEAAHSNGIDNCWYVLEEYITSGARENPGGTC